jgi:diguanylate cyclase (GGDEF)-like protein
MLSKVHILLVDDDEEDFLLTRDLFTEGKLTDFSLEWASSYECGLDTLMQKKHDVYLVDYRLGKHNGLDFLHLALEKGCQAPLIIMTGQGDSEVDLAAMRAGADDYLVKGELTSQLLERSIRYSLESKRAQIALRESEERHRTLLASIQSPVLAVREDMNVLYCNQAYGEVVSKTVEEIMGENLLMLFPLFRETSSHKAYLKCLESGLAQVVEGPWGKGYYRSRVYPTPWGLLAIAEDISERIRLEMDLKELATHDELTGLNNRREMMLILDQEIERFKRYNRPFSIVMMDIDHFKDVNDTYGHIVGDSVLRELGYLIQKIVRLPDIAARYGGDEFAIVMPETKESGAYYMAERIRRSINKRDFSIMKGTEQTLQLTITVSIGVAEVSEATKSIDGIIAKADRALYRSKGQGRNTTVFGRTDDLAPDRGDI